MEASQLHARATFYRERAICADRDQDFEVLLDLATTFEALARELETREASTSKRVRQRARSVPVRLAREWLHGAFARRSGTAA